MCKLSAAVFSTLLSAVLLPQSFAADVTYEIKGRVSGSPMANTDLGYFTFDIEKARTTVQEELPSGIKHNRYEFNFLMFSGFPPLPSLNYDYRIYNQSGGGTFLSPYGEFQNFSIDQYLQSDGSSALSIHGSISRVAMADVLLKVSSLWTTRAVEAAYLRIWPNPYIRGAFLGDRQFSLQLHHFYTGYRYHAYDYRLRYHLHGRRA